MIGWLDCGAGASGDMFLGALADVGVPLAHLQSMVDRLPVERITLRAETTSRHAITATKVFVDAPASPHHRRWSEVADIIGGADLPGPVADRALDAFGRLARAEGAVHGMSPDEVHFHEVGALDAIADIVGTCAGIEWLRTHRGLTELHAGLLTVGGGRARGAHGAIPIPGPAVLGICAEADVPVTGGGLDYEACTPTGAALLAAQVSGWGSLPAMRVRATGVGAGGRDSEQTANVLRLVLGDTAAARRTVDAGATETSPVGAGATEAGPMEAGGTETSPVGAGGTGAGGGRPAGSLLLECNVDDLDPRLWPAVLARLLDVGAADAWLTPILMKKGRPAHTLHVLCDDRHAAAVRAVVFAETSSIGLRAHPVAKYPLDRDADTVYVDGRRIGVKVARHGDAVVNVSVEYEDVAAAARALSRPTKQVLAAAVAAAQRRYGPD